ncbi:MAG: myo-inositol-1(or 4)-monophosphatase [archaeon GW2011_AR3]|nr:MAG: myo-inositol-1(or 4)-monophosphatase [archaeon GW2011_AR3]MBS3110137.1 inositol monophosphatase [Candidatus Woesearchaeota archaeon]
MQESYNPKEFEEMKKVAFDAAIEAGKIIEKYFHANIEKTQKTRGDYVTQADKDVEKRVREMIRAKFPGAHISGEELGRTEDYDDRGFHWLIDPLDGTVNFTFGFPNITTIITIARGNVPVFVVNYQPMTRQMLWAEKGKGAFLGDKRQHVSKISALEDARCAIGIARTDFHAGELLELSSHAFWHFQKTTRTGSIGMTGMSMATGKMEANIANLVPPHDVVPISMIIEEAGGKATTIDGAPLTLGMPENTLFILSNGILHDKLVEYVKKFIK